jgi:hypothetical protein
MSKAKSKAVAVAKGPTDGLTQSQCAVFEDAKQAVKARPRRPEVKLVNKVLKVGDGDTASLDGALAHKALGTESNQVANHLIQRIAEAISSVGDDAADSVAIANALAMVAAIEPENELEANIAVQMVAANEAALFCFKRMRGAQFMEQAAAYSNMANKAARTFAMQIEALQRLRRGGEQVVRHVHVNEGGQAVIANTVNTGRGGVG